ncbi:EscU/YscU/HrcU family type III secretion system export apparatus switch protein [Eleftheria terrae]|uniref:EscU/YscU/HrcU family type III secretion system export apparatus switch protein n=1 Tax=Eleftheria terrae TaxID=1597781 RepID=UPI00263AFCF8|nr:flagellar type III secretion system protein FlhB [Eleftheria terrae]WKB54122.1 flagellar type III secretion system protein FlhB [Eleftheria terrae]
MADASTDDKTEKPSPQKLRKSREQGQVARSRDVPTVVGILIALKLTVLMLPGWLDDFRLLFTHGFAQLSGDGTLDNAWSTAFTTTLLLLVKMVLPLLAVPATVLAASLFPGGWVLSTANMGPKLERLSPAKNLGRLVSGKHWSDFGISLLKAALMIAVLYHVSTSMLGEHLRAAAMPLPQALQHAMGLALDGVMALCVVYAGFALLDLPLQRFFFLQGLRMSKRELKEEHKTSEGRPEVRQRIRQLQQQIARRSVRKTVPGADVVIVNPEHYAVALKYDEDRAQAPFVVAKGVDEMALYIRAVAAEHGVEVVSLPPLARAIYNTSQVHQQIPASLYKAVAHVLGYVLQLQAFRGGRRKSAPQLSTDLDVPPHLT